MRVTGRVQLVMYRDFATRKARGLSLVGEVQNLPDKSVRIVAEGPRPALEKYVRKLEQGSLLSNVEEVSVTWGEATNQYKNFSIQYD